MNSLRSRLILGSVLIALVPLAAAMLLLTRRLESMVHAEAEERLNAVLGGLSAQVAADAGRARQQLGILARDRELRRLYLMEAATSRDLDEYLSERRVLLGLDFLGVADTAGRAVSRAAAPAADSGRGERVEASVPIFYQGTIAGVLTGGLAIDEAFLARLAGGSGIELILRDPTGHVVASTLPLASTEPRREALPTAGADTTGGARGADVRRVTLAGQSFFARDLDLPLGGRPGASILGLVPTAPADRAIAAVQWTSLALGALGLLLAVALGVLWSSQVSRPVERLAAFSHRVAQGEWDEPLALASVRELETLVAALDRMRTDLREYRDRLVVSERQAAWSQMAQQVAHEVRNPLTPIAIAVADLKRSYDQRRPEFPEILAQAVHTIGDEIGSLERMLRGFSDFARMRPPELAPCTAERLLEDLATLYAREVAEGRLAVRSPAEPLALRADAGQLRQALVNLVKNGLESIAGAGRVTVSAERVDGAVTIAVSDDGPGLDAGQRARLFTPGFTTKPGGSGLGLTIVQRIVHDHGGSIAVESGPGTTFRIRLPQTRLETRET